MALRSIVQPTTLSVILLSLAAPAFAQDLCGGVGSGGQWIGGDAANSDITTADNFHEQMALVLGGNDYVALFTLSATTDVRLEAAGRGAGDPMIDLLHADGSLILSDDDSGGNAAARAETTLDAGSYCMAMRSYDGGPMTAFVRIGRQDHEPLTVGIAMQGDPGSSGSCAEAVPIGPLGSSVNGSAIDAPYWSFTLDQPTAVTITAVNENADPVITLYDAAETYITENDDYDGLNSRIDMTDPLAAGTYCINLNALADEAAPITLTVSAFDPQAAVLAIYDRGEAAPPLDGTVPVTDLGLIGTRIRQDVNASSIASWFTVDVDAPGLLMLEAIGNASADPVLVIFDDLGREIGRNDDHGNATDSLIAARVDTGTYVIGVWKYGDGLGLIRLLVERYVPAQ